MKRMATAFLCLLTLVPVFALTACSGCQSMLYKPAIESALHQDALTGREPTDDHVASMRKVDLSNCPDDFRVAYVQYMQAWEQAAKVQKAKAELDSEADAAAAAGFLATLFSSDATPWSDHMRAEEGDADERACERPDQRGLEQH